MSKHRTRTTKWDRLLSGILCLALALGLLPAAGLVQTAEAAHWAEPYAEQLVEWDVMSPAADLRLSDRATRAEFVAMCNRAFGFKRLGSITFTDVPSSKWYAQDINIAYNAGYFEGHSSAIAAPEEPLTREQAAVLLARIMRLQETVGESLGFTDSRELHEWSRGLIGAAVIEGMISGYDDGSYRPFNYITRGELAAMLVRAIGTPVSRVGNHELGDVYGNVTISSSNVTLRDTVILGNLYVTGGVDLGNVLLENVTVLGRIVISGGGVSDAARSSVILRNVEAEELVIDSMINQYVTVSAYGLTDIPLTRVRSNSYLEDSSTTGYGLSRIELVGKSNTELELAGSIKEVVNMTPGSTLKLVEGTAKTITIDELATNSQLEIWINTRVDELNLDVATLVTGQGDIGKLRIWANGCEVDILPEEVEIRPGLTAVVNGEEIGSAEAAELSAEPRLMAGYPKVTALRPTSAEGLYSGNKPGTIYWAVSNVADGSVTVENLINNPAFGGNILKDGEKYQSGSIDADRAKAEYSRLISGLEPDGSYYISAVLVDERDIRSPLKVFSFTTPDDTVPAFVEGYPRMSKVSCDVAQVTAMANKSCTLYWVLLPAGAVAPTKQNFRSGTFGYNYGSGTQSMVKNVPVSINVNSTRLQEKTYYDLYLWLNDFEGGMSSDVIQVTHESAAGTKYSFRTPDETPPIVTYIAQTNYDLDDAIEFNFAINEEPSTLYWAVVPESDWTFIAEDYNPNSSANRITVENGTKKGAIVSGSKAAAGAGVYTLVEAKDFASKLKYETYKTHNFKLWYVAKDADGNYSEVKYIIIHTRDTDPPIVTLDTTYATNGKLAPDGNITLIFSEQVKGSTRLGAETFVDFYNEVLANQAAGGAALAAAKKALADELSAHITLWYKPKSILEGEDTQLPVVDSTPVIGDGSPAPSKYGWVNWSNAVVAMQTDGRVFLTLYGSGENQGVSLGSGMDYYFRFEKIYDDSYNHNCLAVTDENGKIIDGGVATDEVCELPFSTVYATVWLSKDRTGASNTNEDEPDKGVSLDIVFDVIPASTSSMADTEFWDMVIWNTNNIPCKFVVYRSADNGDSWERVTVNKSASAGDIDTGELGEATIYGRDMSAVSLNHYKCSKYITAHGGQYETVKDGLKQGSTYKYAIHFTEVNGSADRSSWTSLLKMEIRLVAGERGNIRTLDDTPNDVAGAYSRLVYTEGVLSEISAVNLGSETVPYLEVEKQFTDDNPPVFFEGYPTLAASSSTITLNVALNRDGKVYYVVAPVGLIPTSLKNGTSINSGNDGTDATPSSLKTYIPIDGADRVKNKDLIQFMTGDNGKKYASPEFGRIFAGSYSDPNGRVKTGQVTYTGIAAPAYITGLQPNTWYYVYMVLQSDSNKLDEVVQIYRVKTTPAQPPTFSLNHSGTTATIDVLNPEAVSDEDRLYDNPDVYYAIVRKDDLPEWFSYKYNWDGSDEDSYLKPGDTGYADSKNMTVLEAMISTAQDQKGKTYFDVYADDIESPASSSKSLKYEVLSYITRANTNDGYGSSMAPYGPINDNQPRYEYKEGDMKQGSEYVMLVCARHHEKLPADDQTNYGFAATQGLYMPDNVPPEFMGVSGKTDGVHRPNYTTVKNRYGTDVTKMAWERMSGVQYFTFSGLIAFSFDKPIYVNRNGALKKVVNKPVSTDLPSDQISILEVINAPGFSITDNNKKYDNGMNFELTFTDIGNDTGFRITDLCNSTGVSKAPGAAKAKTLIINFNTWLTQDDYYDDNEKVFITIYMPAFEISWG